MKTKFKIRKPLKYCIVTQPFGVNYVDFYANLGLKGHNGEDYRCYHDKLSAVFDGTILRAGKYSDGGIGIEIVSDYSDKGGHFKATYYHLKSIEGGVKKGARVIGGQPIGVSDNTGKYTTGDHLHLGIKRCDKNGNVYNINNGYNGAIDFTKWVVDNYYLLPVNERYGKMRNTKTELRNWWIYNNLTQEQRYAIQYGKWDKSEVINPSLRPVWAFLTKEEFKNGKQPEFKLAI